MMRPALGDPIWDRLSPDTRASLHRQITNEASAIERAIARYRRRREPDPDELVLMSDDAAIATEFARLRRWASIDTTVAYAPAAMALATAIWTLGSQVGGSYTFAFTGMFLIFATFGVLSVRLQGKHRPGLNNPDDIARTVRLAQSRVILAGDGLAEFGSASEPGAHLWHPFSGIEHVTAMRDGLVLAGPDGSLTLSLPRMRVYRAGLALPATEARAALAHRLGERYREGEHGTARSQKTHRDLLPWLRSLTSALRRTPSQDSSAPPRSLEARPS